jgi:hypothetical protein
MASFVEPAPQPSSSSSAQCKCIEARLERFADRLSPS